MGAGGRAARLDAVVLQALNQILRMDEERRVKAGSNDDNDEGKSSTMPHPIALSSSPDGGLHANLRHRHRLPFGPHLPPTITTTKTTWAQSYRISLPPLVGSSLTVSTCDANMQRQVGALRSSIQRGLNLN